MPQLCALNQEEFMGILSSFGGVKALRESLGTIKDIPNYDEVTRFIEQVVKDAPPNALRLDVTTQLEQIIEKVFQKTEYTLPQGVVGQKVYNFWKSSPHQEDNTIESVNAANPEKTSNDDAPKKGKILGIGNYFSNVNYIKDFNKNFQEKVNELLFEFTDMQGNVRSTNGNDQLNEAIKVFKNSIAIELVQYLKAHGSIKNLSGEIYDPETLEFNATAFKELIKEGGASITDQNYFINAPEHKRLAFGKLEMLRNFDTYVESLLPDSISIEKGYKRSAFEPDNGIKYKLSNKLHVDKAFGDENNSDIFNHTNDSVRLFIESIPYHDSFAGKEKRLTSNLFITIFQKLNETLPLQMAKLRFAPEENMMKILNTAMDDPTKFLGNRVYLKNHLEGIFKKLDSIYSRDRSEKFTNNLYSMLVSYVNKLTNINYAQYLWNKREGMYEVEVLSNLSDTRLKSNLEKRLQIHSKYNDFSFANKVQFKNSTFIITTKKGTYTIPLNGKDMTILDNTSKNTLTTVANIFDFIMDNKTGDTEFTEIIAEVFDNLIDPEILTIAYNSQLNSFLKVFNLVGNVLLNNEFGKGTREISGTNAIKRNTDYYLTGDGAKYRRIAEGNTGSKEKNIAKLSKQLFDPTLGTLRVAGFNQGTIGRDVIYKAISDINGDSTRSYVTGAAGTKMPLTRLPNLVNIDKVTFESLKLKKDSNFINNNIFSDLFDIATDTRLKTTVTTREGRVAELGELSVADLILSLIVFDYHGDKNNIYVQPVAFSDKKLIWLKGIDRNKEFTYEGVKYAKGFSGMSVDKIQNLHFRTMSKMFLSLQKNLVEDYNKLFKYLVPGTKPVTTYIEGVKVLQDLTKKLQTNDLTEAIYHAVKRAKQDGTDLEIYQLIHYPVIKGDIQPNETLVEQFRIFGDAKEFAKNQMNQKKLWIYIAVKEGLTLDSTFTNGNDNSILSNFGQGITDYKKNWIDEASGEFVIYKVKKKKGDDDFEYLDGVVKYNGKEYDTHHHTFIDAIKFDDDYIVELNPEIDKFFEVNGLITNHYTAATVGLPYIHPVKTTFEKAKSVLEKEGIPKDLLTQATTAKMEAARTAAHSKRMVIFGATEHPYILLKFDGIPEDYNIACVKDKLMAVFNIQGETESGLEQFNGGVLTNPFLSIWEANSLPELALSPIHRKSIMFMPNSKYLASGLGKWATFAMNNEIMRKASTKHQLAVSGHSMMKKMTDHRWIVPNLDITDGGLIKYLGQMYYDKELHNFVRINGIKRIGYNFDHTLGDFLNEYKIDRQIVNNDGSINLDLTEANQEYFNTLPNTINSNYDLWKILGGEYSVSIKTNGNGNFLDWSETSVEKVADVASKIAIRRTLADTDGDLGYETYLAEIKEKSPVHYLKVLTKLQEKYPVNKGEVNYMTQSHFLQPMKHSDVHYVAPETSIKNGIANINPQNAYGNDSFSLNSWSVPSLHLGIQLNSDHHVDNSEVSEMSLVISALAELGTTHAVVNLAYKAIGQSVINNLSDLNVHLTSGSDKVNEEIYYILGKALCESFVKGKGWEDISLANAYLSLVLLEFGKNFEEWKKQDSKFRLPFDDPNIFDAFTNSFTSGKNKDAIKRTYSGLQAVLMPALDLNTLYMVDGRMMSYEDLLMDETKVDQQTGQRIYANAADRLKALDVEVNVHEIVNEDYVLIDNIAYKVQGYKGKPKISGYMPNPEYDAMDANIESLEDPDDPMSRIIYAPNPDYKIPKEVPIGGIVGLSYVRNLKGQKVVRLGSYGTNLKDANQRVKLDPSEASKVLGGYLDYDVWDLDTSKLAHNLKELLVWMDGETLDQNNSNPDKLKERRDFYKLKEGMPDPILTDDIFELYLIYVEVKEKSVKKWKIDHFNGNYDNDLKYVNDILQGDTDNMKLNNIFPIPIKLRTNLKIKEAAIKSSEHDPFQVMIGATQATSFGLRAGDSVLEILDRKEQFFLDRFTSNHNTLASEYDAYLVSHNGNHLHILYKDKNIEQTLDSIHATPLEIETEREGKTTYRLLDGKRAYIINENTEWYQVPLDNGQVYEYVVVEGANELKGILNSGIYDSVAENKDLMANVVIAAENPELSEKDKLIIGLFKMSPSTNRTEKTLLKDIIGPEQYRNWLRDRSDDDLKLENAKKRYQSFLQYLEFIVARIPAQSMQSFMNMKIVGFVNTPTNVALVPAIQLWIQGSDLDIDKAFMLGASISDSGYYNDWSELFNYYDKKTVDASNELPIPDKKTRVLNEELQFGTGIDKDGFPIKLFVDEYNNEFDTTEIQMLNLENYTKETSESPNKIVTLGRLISRIQDSGVLSLNLEPGLIELINIHTEANNLDKFKLNEALKNKIWYLARKSGADIRNLQAQMSPISITAAQDAAAGSTSGKDSNIISLINAASTMMLQLENSIGRDCIGIAATGSKIASAILRHYNELARKVNAGLLKEEDIFIPEKKYIIDGNANGIVSKPTFNNINWTNNPKLRSNPSPDGIYNKMLEHGVPANVLNQISILITISTDNAKELILQKIGATKDLMSIYVYGLLIGEDFSTLANFMIKPELSMVQKKAVASLTNDSRNEMNIAKAVTYYQEKVDPKMFNMGKYLGGIDDLYLTNFQTTAEEAKLAIKEKATQIFNARKKSGEIVEELVEGEEAPVVKGEKVFQEGSVEDIKFDDLLGGQVRDKDILKLQKELIDLLIHQVRTEALSVDKTARPESAKVSKYRSGFMEEEGYDDSLADAEADAIGDDYQEDDNDDEDIGGKIAKNNNLRGYVRYLNEAKSRINDLLQFNDLTHVFSNIETMYKLKTDSEGITLLGRFLSINQGIPTKHVERLNKMLGIEETVQNKIKNVKLLDADGNPIELGEFSLIEFFSNKTKQRQWIQAYGKTGDAFNVLQIVAESPHFSEMWGAFVTVHQAMDNQTLKSRYTEKFARRLKKEDYIKKLTPGDVSKIKGFIQDCFVHKFLSRYFEDKPINIPSDVKMIFNDAGQLVDYKQGSKEFFDLRNTYDRMSFKFWFENNYLKNLKGTYKNNIFLKHLGLTTYPNNLGEPETLAVLPINMMSAKDADKDALTLYNNNFILIKDIQEKVGNSYIGSPSHNYTNGELFFLYNLMVNKNRFGENSLTKIFDTSIWEYKNNPKKASNIITDYFNFERDLLDKPGFEFNEEDYNYRDLELRFAPYSTRGVNPTTRYFYKFGENGKEYYVKEKNKKTGVTAPVKVEIISSSLNLPNLLLDAKFKGTETVIKLSDRIKLLIYNNKLEIKFVECHE